MLYQNFLWLLPITATVNFVAVISPAQANCPGSVPPLEEVQPQMQQRWQELQRRKTYPWGKAQVYKSLQGDRITLASSFDQLRDSQKQEVLNLLQLGNNPHSVYASDGRLLSAVYDACTRFFMLTEKARYSWYYNSIGRSLPNNFPQEALRNAGNPSWRQVRVPISQTRERSIRNLFWNEMGYSQANSGLWIAWVPEHGYFEINVPNGYSVQQLQKFWAVAPRNYRYIVLSTDGTILMDANFDT
ncbi:hypothetical protein [Halotia branconii]|uniref:Toxin co-regulated pilus biosynthesis protein Q C-terminal domain-containing protein n=1 Tax=Halotia branconii CENA392 TaxID=1539056 RepID=A0AAJ6NU09_9CYAN|nr:hypothetical protein [Halotia branconii]WGV26710.1 hypothetical protein QI031_04165 [Halotia branconii CENA392]